MPGWGDLPECQQDQQEEHRIYHGKGLCADVEEHDPVDPLLHEACFVCRPGTTSDPQRILPFGKGADSAEQALAENHSHRQDMTDAEFHIPNAPKRRKIPRQYEYQAKNNKRNKGKMRNHDSIGCEQVHVISRVHIDPIVENH